MTNKMHDMPIGTTVQKADIKALIIPLELNTVAPKNDIVLDGFKLIIGDVSSPNTIYGSWQQITNSMAVFQSAKKREYFLVEAVRNFIRKQNFQELNESLNNEEITDSEFESELDSNEHKYVISLKNITSIEDSNLIAELVERIGTDLRDFSTSEIAEMFSVNEVQLIANLTSIKK